MIEAGQAFINNTFSYVVGEAWKWAKEATLASLGSSLLVGMDLGKVVGKAISNYAFSTDKIIEQYFVIECLLNFEKVMTSVVNDFENAYKSNETAENADNYIKSLELLFSVYDLDYDYTFSFVETARDRGAYNTVKSWITGEDQTIETYRTAISELKASVNLIKPTLTSLQGFRYYYEEDAPMAYDAYFNSHHSVPAAYSKSEPVLNMVPIIDPEKANFIIYQYRVNSDKTLSISKCHTSSKGAIELPKEICGYPVRTIDNYAFRNCKEITSIVFANKLRKIGCEAFYGCTNLSQVTLNRGLEAIYEDAFYGTALTSITIPYTVTSMHSSGRPALRGIKGLKTVIFEDGMTKIPSYALSECASVENVIVPDSVTTIDDYAFNGCGLKDFIFPTGITSIGSNAFSGCTNLKKVYATPNTPGYIFAQENGFEIIEIACQHPETELIIDSYKNCTEDGVRRNVCTVCDMTVSTIIDDATGHDYSVEQVLVAPTCKSEGLKKVFCQYCGDVKEETIAKSSHTYENGACTVCGEAKPDDTVPVIQPVLTLKSPTLEFKDMICINAFYTAENTQNVVEMGMITYDEEVTSISVDTADYVIPGATYVESSGRYYSSSQGIHAKYLGDTVYLAVYAKLSDGSYVYSKLAPYSAINYANNQLKNSTDMKLKQLVVAMLNYGAEAQLFFGHNTEKLANANLTEEQKRMTVAYSSSILDSVVQADSSKVGIFTNSGGFGKRSPAVSFEGAFCINYFFTPSENPKNGVKMFYWTQEDYEAAQTLTSWNATGVVTMDLDENGAYHAVVEGIAARDMDGTIYVAGGYTSNGVSYCTGVLAYSIGSYCVSQAAKDGNIAGLAKATAIYGYHAKQYFG